jgi:transcription elongation factor Elf1
MSGEVKTVKQVCECKNCGNEAEMVVTCTLEEDHDHGAPPPETAADKQRVKGTATCTHCGNEADMWIDI